MRSIAILMWAISAANAAQISAVITNAYYFKLPANTLTALGHFPGFSNLTDNGVTAGPNVAITDISSVGQDVNTLAFPGPRILTNARMFFDVGPSSSLSGALATATSGSVRVTNITNSPVTLLLQASLILDLVVSGPGTAQLNALSYLERFNTGTGQWEAVDAFSSTYFQGESNQSCPVGPGCNYDFGGGMIAANSFADFRSIVSLTGSASQGGASSVPEPSTLGMAAVGCAAVLLGFRRGVTGVAK